MRPRGNGNAEKASSLERACEAGRRLRRALSELRAPSSLGASRLLPPRPPAGRRRPHRAAQTAAQAADLTFSRRVNTPEGERTVPNCNEYLLSGWEHTKRGRGFSWKKFETQNRGRETLDFQEVWNRTWDIIFLINLKKYSFLIYVSICAIDYIPRFTRGKNA